MRLKDWKKSLDLTTLEAADTDKRTSLFATVLLTTRKSFEDYVLQTSSDRRGTIDYVLWTTSYVIRHKTRSYSLSHKLSYRLSFKLGPKDYVLWARYYRIGVID